MQMVYSNETLKNSHLHIFVIFRDYVFDDYEFSLFQIAVMRTQNAKVPCKQR